MKPTKEQYLATAKHHERMAAALSAVGKNKDAEAAKKAAELCKKSAARMSS